MPTPEIFAAIDNDDIAQIGRLLSDNPTMVNSISPDGFTPLQWACHFAKEKAVEILLSRGALLNAVSRNEMRITPLHAAASAGNREAARRICRLLVTKGAELNARQSGGHTALHGAVFHKDIEMVRILIAAGADPMLKNDEGQSSMDLARSAEDTALLAELRKVSG